MTEKAKRQKLWSTTFVMIVFITLLTAMNGNGIHNGIAVYIENVEGPAALSGLIVACFSLSAMVGRLVAGDLSDKHGRRKIILIGSILVLLGCMLALLVKDLRVLLPARIIMGFGFSCVITACSAATVDCIPKSRMGEGLGYSTLAFALSMALGPSCALMLVNWSGTEALFGGFGIMAVIAVVLTLLCRFAPQPEALTTAEILSETLDPVDSEGVRGSMVGSADAASLGNSASFAGRSASLADLANPTGPASSANPTPPPSSKRSLALRLKTLFFVALERRAFRPTLVQLFASFGYCIYITFISVYATHEGLVHVDLFFGVAAGVMVAVRLGGSRFFDRLSVNTLLVPAELCGILGFVTIMMFHTEWALVVTGVLYGLFAGLLQPLLTTEAIRRSPDERRGAASATQQLGADIGIGVGSFLWGFVIDAFGYTAAFLGAILCIGIAILLSLLLLGPDDRRAVHTPT